MKGADQSILQLLGPPRYLELTPSNIARNVGLSRGYTSERLTALVEHDLIVVDDESGSHPYYSISDKGRSFLAGDLQLDELQASE